MDTPSVSKQSFMAKTVAMKKIPMLPSKSMKFTLKDSQRYQRIFTLRIERPEIKNRIGENFIVFNYISYKAAAAIAEKQFRAIQRNLKEQKNINLQIAEKASRELSLELHKEEHISQGGRGVGNVIENMLIRPLSDYLVEHKIWQDSSLTIKGFVQEKGNWSIVCDD
jgi:ATP-dependent Clp protease ATP-binding subunit ClpA